MTAPLTTSTILNPVAPATPVAPASTAETPAGLEFQPVLAALTQTPPSVPPTAVPLPLPALVAAAAAVPAGKPLPAGGESLPLPDEVLLGVGETAELPVGEAVLAPLTTELTASVPEVAVGGDSNGGDLNDTDLASLATTDIATEISADLPALAPSASPETVDVAAPVVAELPVAASTVTPAVAMVVTNPAGSAAPTPVVTPPISGAVKRLLPESTAKAAAVAPTDTATQPASTNTTAADDGAPLFDLSALMPGTESDLGGGESTPSTSSTTTNTAAVARENPLRAYQSTAPATAQVDLPVGRQGFSEAVLEKVMWFSAQQIGSAEIHLNPAELGPLSVRISTHQDQASVYFSSHHAAVRDAVDQALPRLREMFDSQGIQLLDAGVGEQRHARQQAGAQGGEGGGGTLTGDDGEAMVDGAVVDSGSRSVRVSQRLLDAYA